MKAIRALAVVLTTGERSRKAHHFTDTKMKFFDESQSDIIMSERRGNTRNASPLVTRTTIKFSTLTSTKD